MKLEKEIEAIREKIRTKIEKAEAILACIDSKEPGSDKRYARLWGKIMAYQDALKLLD